MKLWWARNSGNVFLITQRQRERVADERAERPDVEQRDHPRLTVRQRPDVGLVSDRASVEAVHPRSTRRSRRATMNGIHTRPA